MTHYVISMTDGSVAIMQTVPQAREVETLESVPLMNTLWDEQTQSEVTRPVLDERGQPTFALRPTTVIEWHDPTPEECLAKWHPDEQAKVVAHQPISPTAIPQDRAFRNAWVLQADAVVHDMDKARAIQRDRLRAEREPLMTALDISQKRAMVAKDDVTVAAIEAKLQALRDVPATPAIDAAKTIDDLKAITLESLVAPVEVVPDGKALA